MINDPAIRSIVNSVETMSRRIKRLEKLPFVAGGGGGGGAPANAPYVTYAADATLTNENILDDGAGLTLTIAGGYATMALTTPGTITSLTLNSSVGNHTHALDANGVVPDVYGDHDYVVGITVDDKGRITDAANISIVVSPATGMYGATAQYQYIVSGPAAGFTPGWSAGYLNITAAQTLAVTTGGTLALGGFTLTVLATGTAALLGVANMFTAAQQIAANLHVDGNFTNYNSQLRDMGYVETSDIRGYGTAYITDKSLNNTTIGSNGTASVGGVRVTTAGVFQIYLNGAWADVVTNFVLREDATFGYTFEHKPVGFTTWIEIMTGQSLNCLGLNGLPISNAYKVSMGAYPVPATIGGRIIT